MKKLPRRAAEKNEAKKKARQCEDSIIYSVSMNHKTTMYSSSTINKKFKKLKTALF